MTRGMNTMPTARRGRTFYHHGANDKRGLGGVCSILFILLLLFVPPILFWASELTRHQRYLTLRDALHSDIWEIDSDLLSDSDTTRALHRNAANVDSIIPLNALIHGTSHSITTQTTDPDLHLTIPGALSLNRIAEYCQWKEITSQICETCTRTVEAKDGSTTNETYECNCVTHYDYVKAWRTYRINSFLFDQPAGHHNPGRDPLPARRFVAQDAVLRFTNDGRSYDENDGGNGDEGSESGRTPNDSRRINANSLEAQLDPSMLSNGIRSQPWRRLDFVPDGRAPPPSFFSRLFTRIFGNFFGGQNRNSIRYEPLSLLQHTPSSPASLNDNFVYVGQGGYFFSPYENPSIASNLMKYFMQYLDGTLFDWQIGDLMPSCTAGDVRVRHEVLDPNTVSVLGRLGSVRDGNGLEITPRVMDGSGTNVMGLVHAGPRTARQMLLDENADSRNAALILRFLLLIWSIPASRLLGVGLNREMSLSSSSMQVMGVVGLYGSVLGGAWLFIWGFDGGVRILEGISSARDSIFLVIMGGYFGYLAFRSSVRRAGVNRSSRLWNWNAVWCRIGQWANVPPEWRVEDSYAVNGPNGSNDGSDAKKSKML